MTARILVLGADVAAGKYVALALAADPSVECVIGTGIADENQVFAKQIGVRAVEVDAQNKRSLRQVLDGVFAVVQAGGPLDNDNNRYHVAQQCIKYSTHYVDMTSARDYVTGIQVLDVKAKAGSALVVTGATAVPAISSALVDSLLQEFDRVDEIHVAVCAAAADVSALALGRALVPSVGQAIRVRQQGRWRETYAWSEPEKLAFPAPASRQRVYWCDFADLDLFPLHYGALTVSARGSLQQPLVNGALAALSRLKRGRVTKSPKQAHSRRFYGFQKLVDVVTGVHVGVRGQRKGTLIGRSACLISRSNSGAAMSCSPALALIKKWIQEGVPSAGAMPCIGLLTLDAIRSELAAHDVILVRS